MATIKTIKEINQALADKLAREGINNPHAPYYGKIVGLANGKVVVVADDLNEVVQRLQAIEPDPTKTFVVEVGYDFDKIHYV